MRFPKEVRVYCPRCKAYTPHQVTTYKPGKRRTLAQGQRRYLRKQKGYGSKRKPEQKEFAKTTKKQVLKLKCNVCGYTLLKSLGRLRKLEIVEKV
jgi:large subunit ribosomal protein L44e